MTKSKAKLCAVGRRGWSIRAVTYLCLNLLPCMALIAQTESGELSTLRQSCQRATQSMDEAESMRQALETVDDSRPVAMGYKAMSEFLIAHHSYNPLTKILCFDKGKAFLERAIRLASESVELRYLRLAIQTKVPLILNYRDSIAMDKEFLLTYIVDKNRRATDIELYHNIRSFLLSCEEIGDAERARILSSD